MIILPAILESWRSLKDRTYKIMFETNELTPEQAAGLNEGLGKAGFVAFKDNPFKEREKELLESLESDYDDGKKSDSQRLRGVLYRLWEKQPEGYEDFNLYKKFKMSKIINHYKKLLDD